jgi:hypothetical protein
MFFVLFMIDLSLVKAQGFDETWLLGYHSTPNDTTFGGTKIDFRESPPVLSYMYNDMNFFETNASISDSTGTLQFYTNGIYVSNKDNAPMPNGMGLNPGQPAIDFHDTGYILDQGAFIIPIPGDLKKYYLIHADFKYSTSDLSAHSPHLYYTVVDMSLEGGLGDVVQKNQVVVNDTLGLGKLTCVRHANGRDWWLLVHEFSSKSYYRYLITPNGIQGLEKGSTSYAISEEGIGQSCFSPDGSFFARMNTVSFEAGQFVDIYKFDRCSGFLSDQIQINYDEDAYAAGLAISPNSRYLYVSSFLNVYQFDLWASDIPASKVKVAEWDGFTDQNIETLFYLAQLAPDGKIYICSTSSPRYLHVINQPNLPYPYCDLQQHGVRLPTWNSVSLPNFPNYRLGPLDGSPCDTLGLDNHPIAKYRYDQDTSSYLHISFTDLSYYAPTSWSWDFGDGSSSNEPSPEHTFPSDGTYDVCLTVSNANSSNTFCRTLIIGTGISEVADASKSNLITVFPNPAREATNVILSDYLPQHAVLYLHTATGQLIHQQRIGFGWNNVPLEGMAPGLYFYEVKDAGRLLGSGKLVVIK